MPEQQNNIDADLVARALNLYREISIPPAVSKPVVVIAPVAKREAIPEPRELSLPAILDCFRQIYAIDTEFHCLDGFNPDPHCIVAYEIRSRRYIRLWKDNFAASCPYDLGPESLIIAFAASAELRCHLSLGWPLPANLIDLFAEARLRFNFPGPERGRSSLLETLDRFEIPHIDPEEKKRLQKLCSAPELPAEMKDQVLAYCQSDVDVLGELLLRLLPDMDLARALVRGEYVKQTAVIENRGIPVAIADHGKITRNRDQIRLDLIAGSPVGPKIFKNGSFNHALFGAWLKKNEITGWETTANDTRYRIDEEYLERIVAVAPPVKPFLDLVLALKPFRKISFGVGPDDRTRSDQVPFGTVSGRNAPRGSVLTAAKLWRWIIEAPERLALIYCDFSNEEYAVAGFKSGDPEMIAGYALPDIYQAVADELGVSRKTAKTAMLAIQYGAGPGRLENSLNIPIDEAGRIFRFHKETYATYWRWSDSVLDQLKLDGIYSLDGDGWAIRLEDTLDGAPLLTARNFPVQGTAASILRKVVIELAKVKIEIVGTLHDAVLVLAPATEAEQQAETICRIMREVSADFLNGHEVRVSDHIYRGRFEDKDGAADWQRVANLLGQYPD